jgi:hypothetical protein
LAAPKRDFPGRENETPHPPTTTALGHERRPQGGKNPRDHGAAISWCSTIAITLDRYLVVYRDRDEAAASPFDKLVA